MAYYQGTCYCKKVQFETKGDPIFTQYCHCNKCRQVAAQSMSKADQKGYAYTAAYLHKNFELTKGEDQLDKQALRNAFLYCCKNCHALIYGISQDPNNQDGIGINANNFNFNTPKPPQTFHPIRHVYYGDRVIDIDDTLPKYLDFPKELGGTDKKVQ